MPEAPGTDAEAPRRIPPHGWRLVLRRVGRRIVVGQVPLLSAGIAFFALLSIAPVLLTAVSVYGAVNTPRQALQQLSAVAGLLPPELEAVVADQLVTITAASTEVQTVRGATALVVALWTATTAATYLIDALTAAYHEIETRPFLHRVALALCFVLGGAVLVGAVTAAGGLVARVTADAPNPVRDAVQVLAWVVLAGLMTVVLGVLYRFAPDRRQPRWAWVSWGATIVTVLWLGSSIALFAYVRWLGTYETTYGSLAGVVISMFWLWLTVFLVIVGATVNAEAERQTARDSTIGPDRPLGQREAVVADSVPPYPGEE